MKCGLHSPVRWRLLTLLKLFDGLSQWQSFVLWGNLFRDKIAFVEYHFSVTLMTFRKGKTESHLTYPYGGICNIKVSDTQVNSDRFHHCRMGATQTQPPLTHRGDCSPRIPTKLWDEGWVDPFTSHASVAENKTSFSGREHTGEWTCMKWVERREGRLARSDPRTAGGDGSRGEWRSSSQSRGQEINRRQSPSPDPASSPQTHRLFSPPLPPASQLQPESPPCSFQRALPGNNKCLCLRLPFLSNPG